MVSKLETKNTTQECIHYAFHKSAHLKTELGLQGRWATFGKETLFSSSEHVGPNLQ